MKDDSRHTQQKSLVQGLVAKAIHYGGDMLEVEYKDYYEEVFVTRNGIGFGIARFKSSSTQGVFLRKELYGLTKKKRLVIIDDEKYELRARIYDSFGEDAFRINLRRI